MHGTERTDPPGEMDVCVVTYHNDAEQVRRRLRASIRDRDFETACGRVVEEDLRGLYTLVRCRGLAPELKEVFGTGRRRERVRPTRSWSRHRPR